MQPTIDFTHAEGNLHMYNTKLRRKYKTRNGSQAYCNKRKKRQTFYEGISDKQKRLYDLFLNYPSDPETFVFNLTNGNLPERSLTQMSFNKVQYNFTLLMKICPEIRVYSHLAGRGQVNADELREDSELDEETFEEALKKLREMGLVE